MPLLPPETWRLGLDSTNLKESRGSFLRLACAVCIAVGISSIASAQSVESSSESEDLQRFIEQRQQIAEELKSLLEGNRNDAPAARQQALNTWNEQNRDRFGALLQNAQRLAEAVANRVRPVINEVEIPADATPELEELLVENVRLKNEREAIENQSRNAKPEVLLKALSEWQQQSLDRFVAQQYRAQQVAVIDRDRVLQVLEAPNIPRSASPPLREFLLEGHALFVERVQEETRIRSLSPGERDAARQAWHEQHIARVAAQMQKAKALFGDHN